MYDVIVIGCGPAGMAAAIYAKRAFKKVLILEKEGIGGQMAMAPLIENYPGFSSILGSSLADKMFTQVTDLEIEVELEEVNKIDVGKIKKIFTEQHVYETKSVILATGGKYQMLGLEGEENFIGNGIHFCVSCDGTFYKDKVVAVIGGGNSAISNAIMLSDICKKVYVIHRSKVFRADFLSVDKLKKKKNVEILLETKVTKLLGSKQLEAIVLSKKQKEEILSIDGMFESIGLVPQSELCKPYVDINEKGFIVSSDTTTSIEGLFVAGDCREKGGRQITIAVSDGTLAALSALRFLEEEK